MDTMYDVEQGTVSPRDNSVNWQFYERYPTLQEARRSATKNRGLWRVVESKVVWQSKATHDHLQRYPT